MQQQLIVGKLSQYPPKSYKGRLSYQVLPQGSKDWVALYSDHPPQVGEQFIVDMTSNAAANGKIYWNAQPIGAQPGQPPVVTFGQAAPAPVPAPVNGNGQAPQTTAPAPETPPLELPPPPELPKRIKLSFREYAFLVEEVHHMARRLEPDPACAQARIALVNAAVIAATQQNLEIPDLPEPEPGADDGRDRRW